ncbi:fimbrial protein [Lelliottia sp. V89_10]|uniref:fimbrial protein n=1 Tax=Lelliottia wanjuensis TaxID=3050585 RepID=UPI00249F5B88|nr:MULTISPECIES: fimbrial protein [unclassified Lelliottia]MDI3360352.1 fimbrial protein [Lelliottia sp. V89_13]MDK9549422.1 fimbrial protein [Lelliottia sp. V89_5]MDK9596163.1 fimbrial protein [Lelliottia sp. V89_10]
MKLIVFFPAIYLGIMLSTTVQATDNVHFSGALVAEPCKLSESDMDIKLDFGSVIEKSLYQYHRTQSKPFTIHLEDCDPTMMSTVSVTFEGTPDDELTTMLALAPTSSAKGVAVGLETADGKMLSINKPSPYIDIEEGLNTLTFNAYLMAQPTRLNNNSLVGGDFTAISTFIMSYQ